MLTTRCGRGRAMCVAQIVGATLTVSCSSSKPATPPPSAAAQLAPPLWGDMKPIVSVKELMRDMIDPIADNIFDAVAIVDTAHGTESHLPKTDDDWDKIRMGAVTLAAGVYLLKVPRPFAPPGDESTKSPVEGEELSPAQIKAKVEADPVLWNAKIEALRNVGLEVMDIVRRRDVNELWDACDNLDQACENCHLEFWYPGERAYLRKLDLHLQELYGNMRPGRTGKLGMQPK